MAVEAVLYEPVSARNSLVAGKNAGKFLRFRPFIRFGVWILA
jgi:hypothetical protein